MRMNDRRFGPDASPGITGGINIGMRPETPVNRPLPVVGAPQMNPRDLRAMVPGSTVMPYGRAYAKGGMVGCDWKAPSAKTMRGAARKGKK